MTNAVNTRELALGILLDITKEGEYSHNAGSDVLDKYQYLDKKDRAFITRLTEGTLEHLLTINYMIDQFSKVSVKKMKPVIRCIIQSAVYQICYMDAVPDSAACNEAVRLAKRKGFQNLSGFVNGVLRTIVRSRTQVVWPDQEKHPVMSLSVRYSVPEWMISMWAEEFSYDLSREQGVQKMEQLLYAFSEPAPVTIRVNTLCSSPRQLWQRLEQEGVTVQACEAGLPYALQISGYDYLRALSSFQQGLFYIQDVSSMLAVCAASVKEHDFVLDVCAAPGGKSMQAALLMNGSGHVLARDLTQHKIDLLDENRKRCGISNIETQVWDARIPDPACFEKADVVLADLPCSGLGVMRRKKDIRYRMTPGKMRDLVQLQREILSVVHAYVKPGGRLVYSTCTVHRDENEGNAEWFEREHAAFKRISSRQIMPNEESGDGFYIAVFQKEL
ncbi:MAG: 16S rRNA (cytosine(967)-C(5))-methyltransferase RsmB [Eubacterium sp.]|nr:16S rRNA (cytosine(967)-C(5))-methyltransferase RsmB [Eubacterium sp.]